jgi:chromate reductase, NAD(P)H dehydrogenase (quinone)
VDHVPRILAFAGSLRQASYNKKLIRIAADAAREAGVEVTLIDLRDFPMPLYDGDLEAEDGIPPDARRFKQLMIEHDGFLISAPEYNSSITGVLKNAIDWASRPEPGQPELAAFRGKVASLMSASPGRLGGLRGLVTVRSILGNIGVLVMPDQVAVPRAFEAFDEEGKLIDRAVDAAIRKLADAHVEILRKLKG